jgi:hypothetical protein
MNSTNTTPDFSNRNTSYSAILFAKCCAIEIQISGSGKINFNYGKLYWNVPLSQYNGILVEPVMNDRYKN